MGAYEDGAQAKPGLGMDAEESARNDETWPPQSLCWTAADPLLYLYVASTATLLVLGCTSTAPPVHFYWTSTGPVLDFGRVSYWTSAGPPVELHWPFY